MKKRNLISALLCSVCLVMANVSPAMADAVKVVTLGADLTQDQKDTMMRYFKVDSSQVQILTITNQDERDHLSSYVPLEQIGSRTVSCAYVKPTQSGGIKVRTANLNWVTCNMIASTLSTSGVSNCEVVAACPFEVSGTGALTGIIMAYETASGEKLDETKKALATEEMVVTGNLGEQVGQNDATNIINQAKMQILQYGTQNADEIYNIVYNIAEQNNVQLSSEQFDKIVSLLEEIAKQNYNYDDVKETLENVDQNVNGSAEEDPVAIESDTDYNNEEDSIVNDVDESVLGDNVIADSTEDPTLAEETNKNSDAPVDSTEGNSEFVEASGEEYTEIPEAAGDEYTEIPEATGDENVEVPAAEDELNTDSLSEEARAQFDRAKKFCTGEFEGDGAALAEAMGDGAQASVVLDAEAGAKVAKEVEKAYLQILKEGTASYVPSDADVYMTTELNMIDAKLRKLFGLEMDETMEEDILVNYTAEDKTALYNDTIRFFESVYGESVRSYEEVVNYSEEGTEETAEEIPAEEMPAEEEIPAE